jgi:multidrug efflux pump subunit AcrB
MTPLLCVLFLKIKKKRGDDPFGSLLYRAYRRFLGAILRWRVVSVLVIMGIFWLALMGFRFVPVIFFPPSDKAIFTVELEMAPGTPVEETRRIVSDLEAFLAPHLLETDTTITQDDAPDEEGIINWAAFIGDGGPRFYLSYDQQMSRPEYAILVVNTTSQATFDEIFEPVEAFMRNYPDVEVTVRPLNIGPPVTTPVAVRISGTTLPGVFEIADQLAGHLAEIPGTRAISDDWGPRTKRLRVNVNQAAAQQAGVSNRDIALSLQTVLSGIESTQYREADEAIPVVMRSLAADREDFSKLETLSVFRLATGNSVPLLQVATLQPAWSPSKILRRGGLPTVTVSADVLPGVTATDINRQIVPWLEEQAESWPIGYRFELGGEAETSGTANQSIAEKLPIALMIIVLLLVGQFNSFRRPLIILLTIPLGVIGVVIGLIVAKSYFGFMTLLGIISLSGIVINNAIVLIDRIKIEIEENGHEPPRAVIEAAQRRLRPILLTTCTTIGGLLPLWFGGGPMWEPMAIAIIFGLLFATLLTLGVVPVLYSLLFRVKYKGFQYPG